MFLSLRFEVVDGYDFYASRNILSCPLALVSEAFVLESCFWVEMEESACLLEPSALFF